jgi:hypothetical protein
MLRGRIVRSLGVGILVVVASSILQPAYAADCTGWWWQKIDCLQKRVTDLEQSQAALQKELRELPQRFAVQVRAVEAKLNKRIDGEVKDIGGQVSESLRRGVKIRNGKEDTCIFSESIGVGGFRKCNNDEREVWVMQAK